MLVRKGLTVPCYFDPTRNAVLDDEHMVRVNYEIYLFSDTEKRARFLDDPVGYCGLVTDPVSKRRFRPSESSRRCEEGGVVWFFASRHTYRRFQSNPERYRLPGYRM